MLLKVKETPNEYSTDIGIPKNYVYCHPLPITEFHIIVKFKKYEKVRDYHFCKNFTQVQLDAPSIVRGVATQGRHVNPNDLCCYQHVTRYRVMYSLDCVNFDTVKDNSGNEMVMSY